MKTKRILHIVILLLINTLINAQDYTWSRMYGKLNSTCIDPENIYNQSGHNSNIGLELDSYGNAYILGNSGNQLHFDPNEQDTTGNFSFGNPTMFLSKYNCEGNNEWTLLISKAGGFAGGFGLQIINDTIYIACNYYLDDSYSDFYFLDTIVNIKPNEYLDFPFRKGCFLSVFASITINGNIIEKHIFYEGTGPFDNNSYSSPSTSTCINKFVLNQNYKYFLLWQKARPQYPESDPKQFFLDNEAFGDSISYADTNIGNHLYDNYRLCKFDKNLSLIKENILIDSVDADCLYPQDFKIYNMIKDKQDNLYLSGELSLVGEKDTVATKCKFYIDGHYIDMFNNVDTSENAYPYKSMQVGFIIKFNSDLECQWIEQNYYTGKLPEEGSFWGMLFYEQFQRIVLNETEDTLFFNGTGNAWYPSTSFIGGTVFSNGDTLLLPDSTQHPSASFLAALRTDNGDFLWYKRDYHSNYQEDVGALSYHKGKIYNAIRWKDVLELPDTTYSSFHPSTGLFNSTTLVYNSLGEYISSSVLNSNGEPQISHIRFDAADNMFFTGYVNYSNRTVLGSDTLINSGMFITRYGKDCPVYSEVHDFICAEDEYILNQEAFTESGLHQQHLYTETGGDSIVNLWLQVTPLMYSGLPTDTNIAENSTLSLALESFYLDYQWQDGTTGTTYEKNYTEQGTDTLWVKIGGYHNIAGTMLYCEHTDTLIVHIGISDIEELENHISLYPNPAKKVVYIKNTPTNVDVVEVCDITGKTVKTIDVNKTQSINIDDLKKGVYFVKAGRFVRKLVKQ